MKQTSQPNDDSVNTKNTDIRRLTYLSRRSIRELDFLPDFCTEALHQMDSTLQHHYESLLLLDDHILLAYILNPSSAQATWQPLLKNIRQFLARHQ